MCLQNEFSSLSSAAKGPTAPSLNNQGSQPPLDYNRGFRPHLPHFFSFTVPEFVPYYAEVLYQATVHRIPDAISQPSTPWFLCLGN